MSIQNPLQVCLPNKSPASKSNATISNRSGRPTMTKAIKFGPQPRSIIIAQILNEKRAINEVNVTDKILPFSDQSESSLEMDYSEDNMIACSLCSHKSYSSQEHMKHQREHKQYICNYPNCNYSCKISSNLIKHKRTHTNEKPYLCEKCCFRSNFINSLKAHKMTHTAERRYQCSYCSYRCNSSSNLKKHYSRRHSDINCQCVKS